jgi:hypothetical protein
MVESKDKRKEMALICLVTEIFENATDVMTFFVCEKNNA